MAVVGGQMQAGPAHAVCDVDVRHVGDEALHASHGVVGSGNVGGGLPVLVPSINIRTVVQEQIDRSLE